MATIEDFEKLDIRVGKIIKVEDFPEAIKPLYKLTIDFGKDVGVKKSAAGVIHYKKSELLGKLILGVVNLQPRQIGPFTSEVLTLGTSDKEGRCVLVVPDKETTTPGDKLY